MSVVCCIVCIYPDYSVCSRVCDVDRAVARDRDVGRCRELGFDGGASVARGAAAFDAQSIATVAYSAGILLLSEESRDPY